MQCSQCKRNSFPSVNIVTEAGGKKKHICDPCMDIIKAEHPGIHFLDIVRKWLSTKTTPLVGANGELF